MMQDTPEHALELRSLITSDGQLELTLAEAPLGELADDDVIIRVEAAPINPSDMGLLFGAADRNAVRCDGTAQSPVVRAPVPPGLMPAMAGRLGQSLPVGNEGAGTVVAAGASPAAQALVGRLVAAIGGGMYATYRRLNYRQCLVLPEGTRADEAASCFVNPLTSLSMVETMRLEGHSALVHTAAASNLGQMLNRICLQDGIGLVNIVRKAEQEALLREQGARHVCNSSSPTFMQNLVEALAATGATLAFDAVGGGTLASQILTAMEAVATRASGAYSRYGSNTHKQVYIYGRLDNGPTQLNRNFGMAWGVGGWLLFPFLRRAGDGVSDRLKARVVSELGTTFASHYTKSVSLQQALTPEEIAVYGRHATGSKYLITPHSGR